MFDIEARLALRLKEPPTYPLKRDGSIKKNTQFIKKLKQGVTNQNIIQLENELLGTKCSKYLEEIVNSIVSSNSDPFLLMRIFVLIHQEHDIMELLQQSLLQLFPKQELKTLLLMTELSFYAEKKVLYKITKQIKDYATFCGYISYFSDLLLKENELVDEKEREKTMELVTSFYDKNVQQLLHEYKEITKKKKREEQERIRKGIQIEEEIHKEFDEKKETLEKFGKKLNLKEFVLPKEEKSVFTIELGLLKKDETLNGWEDISEKNLYEGILDLGNRVPLGLLNRKTGASTSKEQLNEDEIRESQPESQDQENEEGIEPDKPINTAHIQDLLVQLSQPLNKQIVDQIAIDFAYLSNKRTRKELAQQLLQTPNKRLESLPFICRLIKTLDKYSTSITKDILASLMDSFKYHQRKKNQVYIDEKIKNIRFIGEMVKFGLFPLENLFHVIDNLFVDFEFHNINLLCQLLETCGKFLYKFPTVASMLDKYLQGMERKKSQFETHYQFMIDNAIYIVNPPEATIVPTKVRSPMELYLRNLVFTLDRKSIENTVSKIRMFNWNDPDIREMLIATLSKVWKAKFTTLHLLAFLVSEIARYYPDAGIRIVDNTLENIRLGLEMNYFKHNQRRLALMRFLGELFLYRMVNSSVIFDTLYLTLRFGHPNGFSSNVLDRSNDYFRVLLCCELLRTLRSVFKRHSSLKLDQFLVFLQLYLYHKDPMPLFTQNQVLDTVELIKPGNLFNKSEEELLKIWAELALTAKTEEEEEIDVVEGEEEEVNLQEQVEELEEDFEEDDNGYDNLVDQIAGDISEDSDDDFFQIELARMMKTSMKHTGKEFDAPVPTSISKADFDGGSDIQFTLLTKKGTKSAVKSLWLPKDSKFAKETLHAQEMESQERAGLKEKVLNLERSRNTEEELVNEYLNVKSGKDKSKKEKTKNDSGSLKINFGNDDTLDL